MKMMLEEYLSELWDKIYHFQKKKLYIHKILNEYNLIKK